MVAFVTERLFLEQPYLHEAEAVALASGPAGILLDRTVFYARSGGQPGDAGSLTWTEGETSIQDAVKGEGEAILHVPR
jgi:misacylated tRNA(Ala) deacylase